jgi:hypothetical protein
VHGKTHDSRSLELRYDNYLCMVKHCQMARLAGTARDPLYQGTGLRDQSLQRMMVVDNFK